MEKTCRRTRPEAAREKMLWTMDKGTRVAFWGGVSALLATFLDAFGLASCRLVFPVAWLLTAAAYLYRASLTVSPQGKSVVVTGCDSGFGHALALHLHKLGFRVFAGCLDANGEGAASLKRHGSNRLVVLQMDVTNQEQLVKAAQEVKKQLPGEEGLWGLVNNAGLCTLGPVEWLSLKNFKRDPEVNVFGLISATKAFLPLIRRGKGRVVSVASVAGRLSTGFMAAYSTSKYAVEGFNDALRLEMEPFGVKVCLIEPGNYANGTSLFAMDDVVDREVVTMWNNLSDELKADYGEDFCRKVKGFMKNFRRKGERDINPVINAFTEALTQQHPQARYCPMTPLTLFVALVSTHLPEWCYDGLLQILAFLLLKKEDL
ncbi:D-beta-hydroxybutyrate dehydrogenase, mitochondrial-like isoform X2 [Scylla paramamosain]|uniref:D-beta-hydroxybutyrate dehydrogenase, mitochondrial-like isoform X2 n=1 Tax=Scylla paramamosain TaxID=85552 RepID=UPI00308374D1